MAQGSAVAYPPPIGGASLILSFRLCDRTTLILGSNSLAASRAFTALEADSRVVILSKGGLDSACEQLRWRAAEGQITVHDWHALPGSSKLDGEDCELAALDVYLATSVPSVSLVCVTDTVTSQRTRSRTSAEQVYRICRKYNIPVNITDFPDLCDFTFTSTYRFKNCDTSEPTPLQIGVTTNGHGCRLAGRIRREIVGRLPKDVGAAVEKMGALRARAKANSADLWDHLNNEGLSDEETCEDSLANTPNQPVPPRKTSETPSEAARRHMKWIAQISEYWAFQKLANMTGTEMENILRAEPSLVANSLHMPYPVSTPPTSLHGLDISLPSPPQEKGRIFLVGSGLGHPSLLTLAAHTVLTKLADLVLSDKLVPEAVLALIPPGVEVRIARKFPGNADGAQAEMMQAALEGVQKGFTIVRLKQGDPAVYGRYGEEVLYFRSHGFEPLVIPGVSSAIAAPTVAGIPVTQRGVAESFIVCTGVGRAGKSVSLPGYQRSRSVVILMGVARLPEVIRALTDNSSSDLEGQRQREGAAYPPYLPIAIIERASMPDQRIIYSTLEDVLKALESAGEQRPPGLIVVGWSVLALWKGGDVEILGPRHADDSLVQSDRYEGDRDRIRRWFDGDTCRWRIREGLDLEWESV